MQEEGPQNGRAGTRLLTSTRLQLLKHWSCSQKPRPRNPCSPARRRADRGPSSAAQQRRDITAYGLTLLCIKQEPHTYSLSA